MNSSMTQSLNSTLSKSICQSLFLSNCLRRFIQCELLYINDCKKIHVYNPFFLNKILPSNAFTDDKSKNISISKREMIAKYQTVAKWTKGTNIFNKELLIFPMNDNTKFHWSLFIVCFPNNLYRRSYVKKNEKPMIIYFDSVRKL